MTIEVQYNEFTNWATEIRVRHPECEHPDDYVDNAMRGDGEELKGVLYCTICGGIGVIQPPDEDDEIFIDWEHEQ